MIEPEIAFADLSDDAALAEALLKYPFGASASPLSSSAAVRVAEFTEPARPPRRVARPPFLEAPAAVAYLSCLPCCFRSRSGITVLLHPIASDASVLGEGPNCMPSWQFCRRFSQFTATRLGSHEYGCHGAPALAPLPELHYAPIGTERERAISGMRRNASACRRSRRSANSPTPSRAAMLRASYPLLPNAVETY
jgi:hypothetical protein